MDIGKFIVLDGIDGSGTTTHSKILRKWLKNRGYSVLFTREPTTRKIGTLIQKIIKIDKTSSIVDALLFAADRIDHLEKVIRPALKANKIVISDRYVESSIAYQTAAGIEMNWILELNKFAEKPDLIIILDIEPEVGLSRKAKVSDKFENVTFLHKVRENYLQRAKNKHYPVINTNRPINQVQVDLQELVQTII
ncbi:MAG: dTMP kinase [Promethearchaeota archaeon]